MGVREGIERGEGENGSERKEGEKGGRVGVREWREKGEV